MHPTGGLGCGLLLETRLQILVFCTSRPHRNPPLPPPPVALCNSPGKICVALVGGPFEPLAIARPPRLAARGRAKELGARALNPASMTSRLLAPLSGQRRARWRRRLWGPEMRPPRLKGLRVTFPGLGAKHPQTSVGSISKIDATALLAQWLERWSYEP